MNHKSVFIAVLLSIFSLSGCISVQSYVDPAYHQTGYKDLKRPAKPIPAKLAVQFQTNGEHKPAVDATVREHVEKTLKTSGVIEPLAAAQPKAPASAPSTTPNACCTRAGSRASTVLRLQATISQASVPGSAAPLRNAIRHSQSMGLTAPNMAPAPMTLSTNSTARSTTPTWHASNTSAGAAPAPGRAGRSWNADRI